jgi:hypothetical protein
MKIATKRCRSCKDKFCTECYALLHRTGKAGIIAFIYDEQLVNSITLYIGNRKTHSFENVRADPRLLENGSSIQNQTTAAGGKEGGAKAKEKTTKKKEWEGKLLIFCISSTDLIISHYSNSIACFFPFSEFILCFFSLLIRPTLFFPILEFYDDTAKAKYWFNQSSGEATWIQPY